jgi:hypothetical protein
MFPNTSIYLFTARSTIQIEPGWQLIAIPARYGYWATSDEILRDLATVPQIAKVGEYVVAQLEDIYGADVVEICNARIGGETNYRNFIPGQTPAGDPNNFPLMILDADTGLYEVVPFFIKSVHESPMDLAIMEHR